MPQTYRAMTAIEIHGKTFTEYIPDEAIQDRIEALADELDLEYKDKNPVFLGILKGVFVFLADLIRACPFENQTTFSKVSSYKGTQSTGELTFSLEPDINLSGRHIIIVEDIVDSGLTLSRLIPKIQEYKPASIAVISLLFKPESLRYPIQLDYTGFEIGSDFVVGYGLDYDQCGRELRSIYKIVEDE